MPRGWLAWESWDMGMGYFDVLTLARFPYFATFASAGGGGCDPPLVSKLSLVELSRKKQRIALEEYLRLVGRFLMLSQFLTQL